MIRWKRWLLGSIAIGMMAASISTGLLSAAAASGSSAAEEGESSSSAAEAETTEPAAPASAGSVAIISVDRTIETGLQQFLQRAYGEASRSGAGTVVLVIDTFGGRVDAASEIGEDIRSSPLRTVAYVQGKAISAGSYIALNADEIYMQEGSTIGAAAVVDGAGEPVQDAKVVSVWVGAMKGAAERNGRNPNIAIGMVDQSVRVDMPEINEVKEPGHLITLTAREALAVGYAEGVVTSLDDVMQAIGAERQFAIEPTLAEELARILTHPTATTLLFVLGIAGVLIELLVPGFGVPGIVGITAFALYFLGNYVAGFAGVEHIVLFVVGVLLLALELFVPSFGILGILGIISLISGVILAAYDTGNIVSSLGIAVLVSGIVVAVFIRYFKHRGVWNRFILKDAMKTEQGYVSHSSKQSLVGQKGRAVTPLRPSGTIMLNDERVDVVTNGEFIAAGSEVIVVQIEGIRVVVKEASPTKPG